MKHLETRPLFAALALSFCALGAHAQAGLVRVGTLIGTGANLVAGDVTFSNFQPALTPWAGIIPDGLGTLAASASVNADGTVSLTFTIIDPATGLPSLVTTGLMQSVTYDVTVTNPARVLGSINQGMGPLTGNAFEILTHVEPAPAKLVPGQAFGQMIFRDEQSSSPFAPPAILPGTGGRIGALYLGPTAGVPYNSVSSSLPGGLRTRMSLNSFFGITTDNHGIFLPETGPFDSASVTFSLVPASTPNPVQTPALLALDFSQPGIGTLSLAGQPDPRPHLGWAPIGGLPVTMTTSNAAALPLPATLTIPEGASTGIFPVGDAQIDAPTAVNVTASLGGTILQQTMTVQPALPLGLLPIYYGGGATGQQPNFFNFSFNRANYSTQVITLTSSNPALFPVPASLTVPPLAQGIGNVIVSPQPAPAVTPVTITASVNGSSVSRTITLPKYVDLVTLNKAELVVKSGALKVDATGNLAIAVLTLSNATTGQAIGTMTNLGKGKFSYQGTVAPVTTLRLDSNYSGSSSLGVAQK